MPRGSAPGERRGGRKAGTPNKTTQSVIDRAKAKGMLPHEFLAAVARGEEIDGITPTFEQRVDAAKACAPFYAPRLSSTNATVRHLQSLAEITDRELGALAGLVGADDAPESQGLLN